MYKLLKYTPKMFAVFSVAALLFAASVTAEAGERSASMDKTRFPVGVSAQEMLGREVRTNSGEQIASIDDVIVANDGTASVITDVVLNYKGELVAVPIQDMRFTSRNDVVYEGTISNLDAARNRFVYGKGPFVYPSEAGSTQRGYYGTDVGYGTDIRNDRYTSENEVVQSGPDTFPSGKDYYGADLFYGPRMPAHPNQESVENEGHVRSYYDRPYTNDQSRREHYGDKGYTEYGFEGHGVEMHFGPK